jgi:hypothetical protein
MRSSKPVPYFDSNSRQPYEELQWRPTMSLAASISRSEALVDRGIAADGSRPGGTGYLFARATEAQRARAGVSADRREARLIRGSSYVESDFIEGRDECSSTSPGATVEQAHEQPLSTGAIADHLTSAAESWLVESR